jgi:hypothetical protein
VLETGSSWVTRKRSISLSACTDALIGEATHRTMQSAMGDFPVGEIVSGKGLRRANVLDH